MATGREETPRNTLSSLAFRDCLTGSLTTAADVITGTANNDTINGTLPAIAASFDTTATLTAGDQINGGAGTDTLNISVSGSALPGVATATVTPNLAAVEKVLVSNIASEASGSDYVRVDLSLADTALTTIGTSASTTAGVLTDFANVGQNVAVVMAGKGDLTVGFVSAVTSGAADSLGMTANSVGSSTANATFDTDNGFETLNITSATAANYLTLGGITSLTTVNVSGAKDISLNVAGATNTAITTINASTATGATNIDASGLALNAITVTGGAGTADTFTTNQAVSASSKLAAITGFETLAFTGTNTVALDAAVAGVSTINLSSTAGATTLQFNAGYTGATTVKLTGDAGDSVTDNANIALTVNANVADVTTGTTVDAGTGTTDVLNLTADGTGATLTSVVDFETINILAKSSAPSTGTGAIVTVNGNVASTKSVTVNASALTSADAVFNFNASAETDGHYVVTGGAGNDLITTGNAGDSIDGGAGNDGITAGTGNDSINGGAGDDTITMAGNLTSSDTIDGGAGTDSLSVTTIASATAFANVTNVESIAVTESGAAVTLSAAIGTSVTFDFSAASAQSLTLASGYTGTTTVNLTNDTAHDGGTGDSVANSANVVLTVNADMTDLDGTTVTLTGGTGTDTLNITADGSGTGVLSSVTLFEAINVKANATTPTTTATVSGLAVAAGKSVVVDASNLTNSSAAFSYTSGTVTGSLNLTGGAGGDTLSLSGAGSFTVSGGGGKDTITGSTGTDSLAGGDGNDTFTMAANLNVLDTIDGGAGTDTVSITTYNAASLSHVTNVEVLKVMGANTVDLDATAVGFNTLDLTDSNAELANLKAGYTGTTTVSIGGGAGDDVVNGAITTATGKVDSTNSPLWANTTLTVTGAAADFSIANTITGGTGTDTLQITADSNATGAVLTSVTGIENITVKASTTAASNSAKISFANSTFVADGATLTVDASNLTATGATLNYNGQAIANAVTVDSAGGTTSTTTGTGKQVVTGGANADYILTGEGADSVNGGTGNDFINAGLGLDTITGGTGNDIIQVNSGSNLLSFATATDFAAGDRLLFNQVAGTAVTTLTKVTLSTQATLSDYINAAAGTASGDNSAVAWFNFGSNTYVVQDNSTEATFQAGVANNNTVDYVIELAGTLDLTTATKAAVTTVGSTQTLTFATTGVNATTTAPGFVITGTTANETFTGTAGADTINGGGGTDVFTGGGGADSLTGGSGVDTFTFTAAGEETGDVIVGGGADVLKFTGTSQTYTVAANSVTGIVAGVINTASAATAVGVTLTNTQLAQFTTFTADAGAAVADTWTITASTTAAGVNAIDLSAKTITVVDADDSFVVNGAAITTGTGYNITLSASGDQVTLTDGANTVTGGAGVDTITGGSGVDSIKGGAGADVLNGGTGSDFYAYTATTDGSVTPGSGDTIASANFVTTADKLHFATAGFGSIATGNLLVDSNTVAFDTNEATTLTALQTAAGTDANVYSVNLNGSTINGTLYDAIDTKVAAGTAATGAAFYVVSNGTNTVVLYDAAAETAGAGTLVELVFNCIS